MKRNPWYRLGTFRAALALAKILPRDAGQSVAAAIGRASFALGGAAREAARTNLALVTGKQGRELDALCRANFVNFIKMLADYFHATTAAPAQIRALVSGWRGLENIEAARARGKGVIVVTAHLG